MRDNLPRVDPRPGGGCWCHQMYMMNGAGRSPSWRGLPFFDDTLCISIGLAGLPERLCLRFSWLVPVGTGSVPSWLCRLSPIWAHPRLGGVFWAPGETGAVPARGDPRWTGPAMSLPSPLCLTGVHPRPAGSARGAGGCSTGARADPRGAGAAGLQSHPAISSDGPSPVSRGRVVPYVQGQFGHGSIPAPRGLCVPGSPGI